jgi:dTDP-4-dehydrorhamnose reductase
MVLKMENILIIGHNSTIGSALINHFDSSGYKIFSTTRRKELVNNTSIFYLDLLNTKNFTFHQPIDTVYLCAADANIMSCKENTISSYQINVRAQHQLASYFLHKGAQIIYLSSNAVFSDKNDSFTEFSTPMPLSTYGKQKLMAETMLQELSKDIAILRITKVFTPTTLLICNWMKHLQEKKTITAFKDKRTSPVSINTVNYCLELLGNNRLAGIFHLSGPEELSYYNFAIKLADFMDTDKNLVTPTTSKNNLSIEYNQKYNGLTMDHSNTIFQLQHTTIQGLIENLYSNFK